MCKEAARGTGSWGKFALVSWAVIGFSIGISDVTPSAKLRNIKYEIREGYEKVSDYDSPTDRSIAVRAFFSAIYFHRRG
jgi:hypothetical protein